MFPPEKSERGIYQVAVEIECGKEWMAVFTYQAQQVYARRKRSDTPDPVYET